jgi:ABC-type uncharacterized transport system substrate-binding protein
MSFFPDDLSAKRLELLKELLPGASLVAVFSDAGNVGTDLVIGEMEVPSRQLGIDLLVVPVNGPGGFVGAFEAAKRADAHALVLVDNAFITKHRAEIVGLAAKHSLPVFALWKTFAEAGALMAYGASTPPIYGRAAYYVDRVLKGASEFITLLSGAAAGVADASVGAAAGAAGRRFYAQHIGRAIREPCYRVPPRPERNRFRRGQERCCRI